jgi:hypothetical protein
MSGIGLWIPDKEEGMDMSGLWDRHVWPKSLESSLRTGYVWPNRSFWW